MGFACVSPGIAPMGRELPALREVHAQGMGALYGPGCAEHWDAFTPRALPAQGNLLFY